MKYLLITLALLQKFACAQCDTSTIIDLLPTISSCSCGFSVPSYRRVDFSADSFSGGSHLITVTPSQSYPSSASVNYIDLGKCEDLPWGCTTHRDCCSCSYVLEYDFYVSPTPVTQNLIRFDGSSVIFSASNDNADANLYTVTTCAWLQGDPDSRDCSSGSYYYFHSGCPTTTITGFQHPPQTTSVFVPIQSSGPPSFDAVSGSYSVEKCGPRTTSITKLVKPNTFNEATMGSDFNWTFGLNNVLDISPKHQPAEVGSYTLEAKVCLAFFTSICFVTQTTIQITDCQVTSLEIVESSSSLALTQKTYALSSVGPFNFQLSTKQTPPCGYPSSAWAVEKGPTISGSNHDQFLTIDPATGLYSIAPGKSRESQGEYTVEISAVTLHGNNPATPFTVGFTSTTLAQPSSFIMKITTGCESATLTTKTVQPIQLTVWDARALYPFTGEAFADFTDSASTMRGDPNWCPKTYSAFISSKTSSEDLSEFQLSTSDKKFWISSQNYIQHGSYSAILKASLVEHQAIEASTSFQITVLDPCLSTTLIPPLLPLDKMTTSVLVQQINLTPFYQTQQVGEFNDSVSVTHGVSNGTQYCSARLHSISVVANTATTALSPSELTIGSFSGLISVYTANPSTIGTHDVTVKVELSSYSQFTHTFPPFTIEILPCIVTAFSMVNLSPSYDTNYVIADTLRSWSVPIAGLTSQVPACGYSQILTIGPHPSFLTAAVASSQLDFSVQTRDVSDASLNSVEIFSTLQSYNFSPPRDAPVSKSAFQLTVTDPCSITDIADVPANVENFVTFAGYTVQSQSKYNFNDTDSMIRTLVTDSTDFCGEKELKFIIKNLTTTSIKAKNSDFIHFSPFSNSVEFGPEQAQMIAYLKSYPNVISAPLNFTVTTLGSVVPKIQPKYYQVGQQELQIVFDSFMVLPEDYNAGQSSVVGYLLEKGASIGEFIDLQCGCLQKIDNLDWLTFDESTNKVTVRTSNSQYVGDHFIVLVQSFENFKDVHPYAQFKLTILPLPSSAPSFPPYFEPAILAKVHVTQCKNMTLKPWSFELPSILDPANSPVELQVNLDQSFFTYNNQSSTIRQKEIHEEAVIQTIKFTLKNLQNKTATFLMKVSFDCPAIFVSTSAPEMKQNTNQSKALMKRPVWIGSISRQGVVELKFYSDVFVPNLTHAENQSFANGSRRMKQKNSNQSLDDYIHREVLQVQLQTQYELLDVNWSCISFQKLSLKLQLNFSNPIEVSQGHQDQLVVKFRQPDLFVLHSESEYLFHNESEKVLYFIVPKQLPISAATAMLQAVAESTESVGWGMIIGMLLLQIIAKKVISTMWIYYCSLQLVLLIVLHGSIPAPVSVEMIISQIAGIINLSSLDKDAVAKLLHLDSLTQSAVFQSLDGVALSAIGILFAVLVIGVAIVITRQIPKLQEFFTSIKNTIFWNFLIRYFQASYIGFNFAALMSVQLSGGGLQDIGSSVVIIMVQYALVIYSGLLLLLRDLTTLGTRASRKSIGNLYFNLDAKKRVKVLFGLIFFIQRSIVVVLLAFCPHSSVQWQLRQIVFFLNTAYLYIVSPYSDPSNSTLDQVNCIFLLLISTLQITYSVWNTDIYDRFLYGMGFAALVILQFVVNFVFILRQASNSVILKLKQRQYRIKYRNRKRKNRRADVEEVYERQKKMNVKGKNRQQILPIRNFQEDENHEMPLKKKDNDRKLVEKLQFHEDQSFQKTRNLTYDEILEAQRKRYHHHSRLSRISEEDESEYGILTIKEETKPQDALQLLIQKKLKSTSQLQLSELLPISNTDYNQVNYNRPLDNTPASQQYPQLAPDLTQDKKEPPKLRSLFEKTNQNIQYISVKPKKKVDFSKVADSLFSKFTQEVTKPPQIKLSQVQKNVLEMEVKEYFQIGNRSVRRYHLDKIFTWQDDIWPYYKQVIDPNYQGQIITQDQHVQQMVQHLKKLWIETYPEQPYLPLQMKVDFYLQTCLEIEPQVKRAVAGKLAHI